MVIRRDDRVATVLAADERLIDVFVSLSPAFERLRNPAMRKVMSRLVTVEQAARMAGVNADELVARLNGEGNGAASTAAGRAPSSPRLPPHLAALDDDAIVEVDVREDLRNGQEPFSRIMAARREVPPGGALRVRAIFEPVPLYAVMAKQGLEHHTEELGPEDWRVWFFSGAIATEPPPGDAQHASARAAADVEAEDDVVVLDVRGLEPPEPMVRTLEALETLPAGGTLVQLNVRVPRFLLPLLDERGFTYEIREQEPDLVRVFIRRAGEA